MQNDDIAGRELKRLRLNLDNAAASLAAGELRFVQSGFRSAIAAKEVAELLINSVGGQCG